MYACMIYVDTPFNSTFEILCFLIRNIEKILYLKELAYVNYQGRTQFSSTSIIYISYTVRFTVL